MSHMAKELFWERVECEYFFYRSSCLAASSINILDEHVQPL